MAVASDVTVMRLDELVEELPVDDRLAFEQIFHVSSTRGELVIPDTMREWVEERFGNSELVRQ
ncbi:MAG: hypothetical protein IIC89_08410, partial [Chloroflexi bacterium]|nr:hypothetical protein [Chloroflexota bacterium]